VRDLEMAVLPATKKITRADLGKDAPDWVNNLLEPLNSFIEQIYTSFNRNITLPENVASQIITVEINTTSTYSSGDFPSINFKRTLARKANLLIIGKAVESESSNFTNGVFPTWDDNNGTIAINYISGLANSKKYYFTFLLI
jgi:hypothetical protein